MTTLLERLRRPEYTGDNRCLPCTITNAVLLTIVAGLAAVVGRRRLAAAIVTVGGVSIALRGYFVPYTPRFAPHLAAALPIDAFDRAHGRSDERDASGSLSDADTATDVDAGTGTVADADATLEDVAETNAPSGDAVVEALFEAGAVVPDGEEIRLEPSFRDDWQAAMRTLRDRDLEELAAVADRLTDPAVDARATRSWGRPVLVLDGPGSGLVTLRRGVAVAELAAARALESRLEDDAVRRAAGRPLRTLLERCPLCDGELTVSQASCCGEVTPAGETPTEKLFCPACDERFFTFD